jgi:cyclin H
LEVYTTHIPKTTPQDVLDLEFLVAQSLNFEFVVWHAHRSLWGIWLDVQVLKTDHLDFDRILLFVLQKLQGINENWDISLYDIALKHVRASRLSDAELIYPPSQIALAALSLANPELASQWIKARVTDVAGMDDLKQVLDRVQSMITLQGQPPSVDDVREVDRRLRLCKNPEKVVGSKAYLAKQMNDERIAAEKRSKKTAESNKAMEGDDPFGTELKSKGLVDYEDDDDDED